MHELVSLLVCSNYGWNRTQQSTHYIVRTQSDSTSLTTPGMHPKQRTNMHNIHVIENMFALMLCIALNRRLATRLVPSDTDTVPTRRPAALCSLAGSG